MLVGKIRFEAVTRRLYFNKVWLCLAFLFTYFFTHCPIREWSHFAVTDICIGKILAFRPGHPKWDQNSQFLTLSETTSISFTFMWGSPPRWRCIRNGLLVCKSTKKCLDLFSCKVFYAENVLKWTQKKLTLSFPIFWFKTLWCIGLRLVLAMPWSGCSNNRGFNEKRATRRDAKDIPRVPMVRLTLVSPGAVDCSLAVTNNSPVWRPQGTHGEAYPCITWCSWLFISSD